MIQKVLIIEDNVQNMYMLSYLLEKNNYSVLKAYNSFDGIDTAKQNNPDVILLDIQLPQMDGYAVAKKVREIKELDNTPIIAVTSYAMVGDREKIIAAGANGYIEKPIDPENFIDTMEEIVLNFSGEKL